MTIIINPLGMDDVIVKGILISQLFFSAFFPFFFFFFFFVRCLVCNRMYALTYVRTLKMPNTGSHTVVWTNENTAHIDRPECIAAALPYPSKATRFYRKGQ